MWSYSRNQESTRKFTRGELFANTLVESTHRANTPKLVPTTVTMGGSVSKRESDQKLDAAEAEKRQKKVSEPQPSVTWTADMAGEASAGAGEEDLVQTVFRWDHGGNQVRRIS